MDVDPILPHNTFKIPPTTSAWQWKFPCHFEDFLPALPTPLPHMPKPVNRRPPPDSKTEPSLQPSNQCEPSIDHPENIFYKTEPNEYGLFQVYTTLPSLDPKDETTIDSLCDAPSFAVAEPDGGFWWSGFSTLACNVVNENNFAPFLSATVFCLMNWFYSGSNMKSVAELDRLIKEVLLADDFDKKDLDDFNATPELW